jgi:beta-lactamase class A
MNRVDFENVLSGLYKEAEGEVNVSLRELRTGEVYNYNADKVTVTPASTVKLGIMCAALHKVQEGLISLDDTLVCRKEDTVPGSGVLRHLSEGTAMALRDMLTLMIIQSDNLATNLVIDHIGYGYINGFFDLSGLTDIRVRRKMFDLEGLAKGIYNETSAAALTGLLCDLETRAYLNEEYAAIAIDILLKQQLHSLRRYICNYWDNEGNGYNFPVKVACKSGSVDAAEHDCGIIYTPKSVIAVSVLTEGLPPQAGKEFIGRVAELAEGGH